MITFIYVTLFYHVILDANLVGSSTSLVGIWKLYQSVFLFQYARRIFDFNKLSLSSLMLHELR